MFTIPGHAARVAKLYRKPPTTQTVDKLGVMVKLASGDLLKVAAWPCDLLFTPGRQVAGFVMPRLTGFEPIHHLYNPAQRLKYFPRKGWNFILWVARNLAAAFEEVHRAGCLVGDINQSNILVSPEGVAGLIDCDSFQVQVPGRDFLCEVGVPHYTPPELQNRNFRGLVRTENHDRFGLAVVLFQLLFVGRHPYAGVFSGRGDLPFEQAIQEYRFAYAPNAATYQLSPPPHAPHLSDLPPELASLFVRAFGHGSDRGTRPTATEWKNSVEALYRRLATCGEDDGHFYWNGRPECVWCRIARTGPDYFLGVSSSATSFKLDDPAIQELLRRLQSAQLQDFPYYRENYGPSSPPSPEPLPENVREHVTLSYVLTAATVLGAFLVLVGCLVGKFLLLFGLFTALIFGAWLGILAAASPWAREGHRRRSALTAAQARLEEVEARWAAIVDGYRRRHGALSTEVGSLLTSLRSLPARYAEEKKQLVRDMERLALRQHLQSCFIADASIPNIGEGRKQTLAAYNILTAYDIEAHRIQSIKGFKEALTRQLLEWRAAMTRPFRFDPAKGVPLTDRQALTSKYQKTQRHQLSEAMRLLVGIEALAPDAGNQLQTLVPHLRAAVTDFLTAEANIRVFDQRQS